MRKIFSKILIVFFFLLALSPANAAESAVWTWGINNHGQLGDGTTTNRPTPAEVNGLSGVVAADGGLYHTIALRDDGTVWAWGYNSDGQLGDGTIVDRHTPVQVTGLSGAVAIAAGITHGIALKNDGTVWTWGNNLWGQIGDGQWDDRYTPIKVSGLSGITAIAGGGNHTIALKNDGTVWAWGDNFKGQLGDGTTIGKRTPVKVIGLSGAAIAIAAGFGHSMAIKGDGTVWAWGDNLSGQLGDGTSGKYTPVHTPVQVSGLSGVVVVAGGVNHSIALKGDGTVWAWGENVNGGQLGDGTWINRPTPVQVSGLSGITAIAGGGSHTIALKNDGTVWAWGNNGSGQLGDGTTVDKRIPVKLNGLTVVTAIAAGSSHSLAITGISGGGSGTDTTPPSGTILINNGAVYSNSLTVTLSLSAIDDSGAVSDMRFSNDGTTWGGWEAYAAVKLWTVAPGDGARTVYAQFRDNSGKISQTVNDSITIDMTAPVLSASTSGGIYSSSQSVTISCTDGTGSGCDKIYYTTDGTTPTVTSTVFSGPIFLIPTVTLKFFAVDKAGNAAAVKTETYTISPDGTVWHWGNRTYQSGVVELNDTAAKVRGISSVIAIAGGGYYSVVLKEDGTVWTWGNNGVGQLGDGTTAFREFPVKVVGISGIAAISAGYGHAMALKDDGTVWAWGGNGDGQLGDGTMVNKYEPVQVSGLSGIVAIAAENTHSLALKNDGTVWAWGDNFYAQLGDGTTDDRHTPLKVGSLSGIVAIAGGYLHTIALKNDGTVWTWGNNSYGQLGDGTKLGKKIPVQVSGLSGIVAIAGGDAHSIALRNDGTVWTWGENWTGQLGDGTTVQRHTPVQVTGVSGVVAIAAGTNYTLALKSDGTVWAWGDNLSGQLGVPAAGDNVTGELGTSYSYTPVKVVELSGVTAIAAGTEHSLALTGTFGGGVADTTPPSGSISINNGASTSIGLTVTLSLSCTDAGGCAQMQFSNDNLTWSAWEAYTSSKSWALLSGNGTKTVYVKFRDNAGNISAAFSDTILLDYAAPMGSVSINNGAANTNSTSVTLTLSCTGANGCAQMQFSNDNITWFAWEVYATSKSWTLTAGNGTKTVYVKFKDIIGNTSAAVSDSIVFDATAPTGSISINNGAVATNSTSATLTLSCTDANGCAQMQFSNDNTTWSTWEAFAANKAWALSSGNGTKTVYVKLKDNSGNISVAFSDTIVLDSTAPMGSVSINNGAAATNSTSATLTLSCTDANGCAQMQFSNDNVTFSAWQSYISSKAWTLAAGSGTKTVYVKFKDSVGNISAAFSDTIVIDTTAPTGSVNVNNGAASTNSTFATLILSCADANGCAQMQFSNDNLTWSAWEAYASSKSWILISGNGTKTVYVKFKDNASIISAAFSDTIVFDAIAPTGSVRINNGAPATNSTSATLTLSCNDANSCAQMQFSNDNTTWSAWEAYASSKSWTLTAGYGAKTVSVKFMDGAGNVIVVSAYTLFTSNDFGVWGLNYYGQLGDGTMSNRITPAQVSGLTGVVAAAGGYYHSLALKSGGTVWAWGYNAHGQLGDGTMLNRNTPVQVSGLTGVVAVAGGADHSLALKSEGIVLAWGTNGHGQLGDGTTVQRNTPVQVSGLTGVVAIAGGLAYSLALKSDGTVWAWGNNLFGQLGDGTTTSRNTPVQVSGLTGVVAVAGGTYHSLALKYDGTVWAWGYNNYGQLGDGTMLNRNTPIQVSGLTGVVAVAGGTDYSLALKSDGTVWTWGNNNYGQLGDGTAVNRLTPVHVNGLSGVAAIACGSTHALALKDDGTVWAWGNNNSGQLGDATTSHKKFPVQVSAFTGAVSIAGGHSHSLAIAVDAIPTGTIFINSGAASTNSSSATLTLSCTDASGCAQMQFSNDGSTWSAWEAYATSKIWTLSSGNDIKTVYVRFKDSAGNMSVVVSDTIVLDTTSPTGSIKINNGVAGTNSISATLTLSCTDASGCAQMRFSNDNSTWSTWEPYAVNTTWSLTPGDGTKTVYAQFKDNAGNISTAASDSILLAGSVITGLEVNIACPSSVMAGQPLSVTVYLSNYNPESNPITVNRMTTLLYGNVNNTIFGAGIWGPFNKTLATPKVVPAWGAASPLNLQIIDAVPASLKGTVAEVSLEAITATGQSYDGGMCSVPVQ